MKLALVVGISIAIFLAVFLYVMFALYTSKEVKKALVADGLSLDFPNQQPIDRIAEMLRKAGFEVTIVRGSDVNLTLYSGPASACASY